MSNINNGGPAFPQEFAMSPPSHQGMSLRDYFAAKAMQGMLAAADPYSTDELCGYAYAVADAMLKAREVQQ